MDSSSIDGVAIFTEDVSANKDIPCGRQECTVVLRPGDPRHYFRNSSGTYGKFICTDCFAYYTNKPGTLLRRSNDKGGKADSHQRRTNQSAHAEEDSIISPAVARQVSHHASGSKNIDVDAIRRSVNQAQRKDSGFMARKVTALPPSTTSAIQPWNLKQPIPNINVPTAWLSSANGGLSSRGTATGYSGAHALYEVEKEKMRKMAYMSRQHETIGVIFQVVREVSTKSRSVLVNNIQEGYNEIPAVATPPELRLLAEELICSYFVNFLHGQIYRDQNKISPIKCQELYESPERARMREALMSGGLLSNIPIALVDQVVESIQFHPIPVVGLMELLENRRTSMFIPGNGIPATVTIDTSKPLGIGACKTANRGKLTLNPLNMSGLGTTVNQEVAVKRVYYQTKPRGRGMNKVRCYVYETERDKTLIEANVTYWATSLLSFAYAFIDKHISSKGEPPFSIPRVRFVYAALGIFHPSSSIPTDGSPSPSRKAYLIEEFIDSKQFENGEFIKFINNSSAVPFISKDHPLYHIAEFLSFTQHVQYVKSKGLVYISDFQGNGSLLCDPQIMTSPTLQRDVGLFGDGNIGDVFNEFPFEHVCNKYCKWFELPDLTYTLTPPISEGNEEAGIV